jgi:hypothetical protein
MTTRIKFARRRPKLRISFNGILFKSFDLMARFTAFFFVLALCFSTNLSGQEILALSPWGEVRSVDSKTGDNTFVGWTGFYSELWTGMAKNSQGDIFASYGAFNTAYQIFEIDAITGQATLVCQTNLFGIGGISFGPGDTLYAANDRTTPSMPHPYDLYTIDISTGQTSLVGPMGVNIVASLNFGQGEMWCYAEQVGLAKVDLVSGQATDVNPGFWGPWLSIDSMCFTDDGTLFQLNSWLWIMDLESGVPSMIGDNDPFFSCSGMEFLPNQIEPFALWTSGESGGSMKLKVAGATPNGQIAIAVARGGGGPTPIPTGYPCAGLLLDLNSSMSLLRVEMADSNGKASIGPMAVPPSAAGRIRLQAIDLTACTTSNRTRIIF